MFGAGRYAPNTDEGRNLLAHGLTHVVQQTPFLSHKTQRSSVCLKRPAQRRPFLEP